MRLQHMPDDLMVKIIKKLFEQFPLEASELTSYMIIILSNMKIINNVLQAEDAKHIFDLLNTDTWIRMIVSMGFNICTGIFENKKLFWNTKDVQYQKKYVSECRYTSRAHDLIDLLDHSDKIMKKTARILLDKLIEDEPTKEGKDFLKGNVVRINFRENNGSVKEIYDKDKLRILCFNNEDDISFAVNLLDENVSVRFWDIRGLNDTSVRILLSSNITCTFAFKITDEINLKYWDTSNLKNASFMFRNSNALLTGLENWNTCRINNMSNMFVNNKRFNCDISQWNTKNVTSTKNMFAGAHSFNQNLQWDTKNVRNMEGMFIRALSYNNKGQPLLWKTSNVSNISSMFFGALAFNADISNWDTSKIINMSRVFMDAKSFNKPLNNWKTENVLDMSNMFQYALSFNQSLDKWNTQSVRNMSDMFSSAISFNCDISKWNTSKVEIMACMFMNATAFNCDISKWDTKNVFSMTFMFMNTPSFTQVLRWNTGSLTDNNISSIFAQSGGRFFR
jgi:surface protein